MKSVKGDKRSNRDNIGNCFICKQPIKSNELSEVDGEGYPLVVLMTVGNPVFAHTVHPGIREQYDAVIEYDLATDGSNGPRELREAQKRLHKVIARVNEQGVVDLRQGAKYANTNSG